MGVIGVMVAVGMVPVKREVSLKLGLDTSLSESAGTREQLSEAKGIL